MKKQANATINTMNNKYLVLYYSYIAEGKIKNNKWIRTHGRSTGYSVSVAIYDMLNNVLPREVGSGAHCNCDRPLTSYQVRHTR